MAQGTLLLNSICIDLNISKASFNKWHKDLPAKVPQYLLGLDTSVSSSSISIRSDFSFECKKSHDSSTQLDSSLILLMRSFAMWWGGMTGACLSCALLLFAIVQKATQLKPEWYGASQCGTQSKALNLICKVSFVCHENSPNTQKNATNCDHGSEANHPSRCNLAERLGKATSWRVMVVILKV